MNRFRPAMLVALAVLIGLSGTGVARAAAHVYLLRGIFNVSVGLDALAGKLAHQGVAATVYGHDEESAVATLAAQQYQAGTARPIILIGHSLGAGAAVAVARQLNSSGIPVALLVLLDPVSASAVPPNVGRAVNLYVSGGQGTAVGAKPGFRGSLNNMDYRGAGMDHMSIQAADSVHRQIMGYVASVAGGRVHEARTASRAAPRAVAVSGTAKHPAAVHRAGRTKTAQHHG
jgi:pimeloyl-ACP methyl ester carboxylesterase